MGTADPLIGFMQDSLRRLPSYEKPACLLGVHLIAFTPRGIDWSKEEVKGLFFNGKTWKEKTERMPDAIYNRCYADRTKVIQDLKQLLGEKKIFNSRTKLDKWVTHQCLLEKGFQRSLPPTYLLSDVDILTVLKKHRSCLIKPRFGSLGYGVGVLTLDEDGFFHYFPEKTKKTAMGQQPELHSFLRRKMNGDQVLVQPFMPFSTGREVFDFRVLVQKQSPTSWQVTGMLTRVAFQGYFIANACKEVLSVPRFLQTRGYRTSLEGEISALCLRIARALDGPLGFMGEIGVDVGVTLKGEIFCIEVNGKPMKSMFKDVDTKILKESFLVPLRFALQLAKGS